jgi:hypothetical protein
MINIRKIVLQIGYIMFMLTNVGVQRGKGHKTKKKCNLKNGGIRTQPLP